MEGYECRTIERADLVAWVGRLLQHAEVIAPVKGQGGDEVFASVGAPEDVLWSFRNPLMPPKHVLLPQTDELAQIRRVDGHYRIETPPAPPQRILLNVRSCDAVGLAMLRQVHADDLPDASVLRRYDALTVVSLACGEPCPLGFCVCCDAGPFLHSDYDLQLTDLGDRVHAEPGTDKGQALLDLAPDLFRPAVAEDTGARAAAEHQALGAFGKETCHFGAAMRRISTRRVAEELWAQMSPWCLECGGCNFACPTCYCFSTADRTDEDGCVTRCRNWDSCQYAEFTLEASGHNPRRERADRMKRRFFHKVSAQYFQREGRVGCVGCGRCVQVCMGTTDVPAVVGAIRKGAWQPGRPA